MDSIPPGADQAIAGQRQWTLAVPDRGAAGGRRKGRIEELPSSPVTGRRMQEGLSSTSRQEVDPQSTKRKAEVNYGGMQGPSGGSPKRVRGGPGQRNATAHERTMPGLTKVLEDLSVVASDKMESRARQGKQKEAPTPVRREPCGTSLKQK